MRFVWLGMILMACGGGAADDIAPVDGDADTDADTDADADAELGGDVFDTATTEALTWDFEVGPFLDLRCGQCHVLDARGSLQWAGTDDLVDAPSGQGNAALIVPGDPEQSYLQAKLEGRHYELGGVGSRMPVGGGMLHPGAVFQIRRWVSEGAR